MTPYASVALFRRHGNIVFKRPRKERPADVTQARKAAMRFWRAQESKTDLLLNLFVVREIGGKLEVSERGSINIDKPWVQYNKDIGGAMKEPHLAACLAELGIDPSVAPTPLPDEIEINGITYRRAS